jgi:hypothetical protein
MHRRFLALVIALLPLACNYDAPIAATPSRNIEPRLIGAWTAKGDDDKPEHMTIRQYDVDHYAVLYDGELYRAYHTEVAGLPLISVQNLNDSERKYLFVSWSLSSDGSRLTLHAMSTDVVPESAKDSATIVKLIEKNRDNPKLFGEAAEFTRDKR